MTLVAAVTAGLLAAGCGASQDDVRRGSPPDASSTAPPTQGRPLGVRGADPMVSARLLELRRTGPRVISAVVRLDRDRRAVGGWEIDLGGREGHFHSAEGLRLVDDVNGREHFPFVDAAGDCLCTVGLPDTLAPGDSAVVAARFPAPAPDVRSVSVHVPGFPGFDQVELRP